MKTADYIILGAGASGLQLAYRMAMDSFFNKKNILIIDKEKKRNNDKTWCYWEKEKGEWDDIIYKSWDIIYFGSEWLCNNMSISPYSYKMIRSKHYYNKLWNSLQNKSNISFLQTEVKTINPQSNSVEVNTSAGMFFASKVFNSLLWNTSYKTQKKYPVLQQHFVGWFVKIDKPLFNDTVATFMDFNIPQKGNTRFMYVLPTSKTEALFEYTLFSKSLLELSEYENAIASYLKDKGIHNYTILEKEQGIIPMTAYRFWKHNTKNILNIGTAGGWTKASTGYTFSSISKKTKALVSFLKQSENLNNFSKTNKYFFYDLLMLDVLADNNVHGAKLFSDLFKTLSPQSILKFLDEESTLLEDLKIMSIVEKKRFIKAIFRRLF